MKTRKEIGDKYGQRSIYVVEVYYPNSGWEAYRTNAGEKIILMR